jgi:hypothetical protein
MATLILRQVKGSPLTNAEVDDNFSNLDNNKVQIGGDLSGSTSNPVVAKLQGFSVSSATPASGNTLIWTGSAWAPQYVTVSGLTTMVNTVLNDISHQFDKISQVFNLRLGQSLISGTEYTDNKDLSVVLDGRPLEPQIAEYNYYAPWFSEFTAGRTNSFRVKGSRLTFFKQPTTKTTVFVTINTKSSTKQTRKYPVSHTNIAFGD